MKAFTTASFLLGLLSAFSTSSALTPYPGPVKAQAEYTTQEGVTFRASRFNDGRSTPYRIYFWDEHLTGSSYRFSPEGHVVYFKAGDEVYYDRMEKNDGSLAFKRKEAKDAGGRDGNMPMDQGLFDCDGCTADLAAVCDYGLPSFCANVDEYHLSHEGAYSVGILCRNYQELCFALQEACDTICVAELEQSESTRRETVPFLSSNISSSVVAAS